MQTVGPYLKLGRFDACSHGSILFLGKNSLKSHNFILYLQFFMSHTDNRATDSRRFITLAQRKYFHVLFSRQLILNVQIDSPTQFESFGIPDS